MRRESTDQTECTKSLVLLCGLPASGKSTLLQTLLRLWRESEPELHVTVVSIDELQGSLGFTRDGWHAARVQASTMATEALRTSTTGRVLVMIDDTMMYRSMRKQFFGLAAENDAAFQLLYLQCALSICLTRNTARKRQIPEDVIHRAAFQFEPPDGSRFYWERRIHNCNSAENDVRSDSYCSDLACRLLKNWQRAERMPDPVVLKQQRQGSSCHTLIHQLDLRMRKTISQRMTLHKSTQRTRNLDHFAKRMNVIRAQRLARLKTTLAFTEDDNGNDDTVMTELMAFIECLDRIESANEINAQKH